MKVPVIDFSSYDPANPAAVSAIAAQVNDALGGMGFMSISNLGISAELQSRVFEASKAFFALPVAEKEKLAYSGDKDNFGYQGVLSERLEPSKPADLKELLTMRNLPKHLDENWPSDEFRDLILEFYNHFFDAARRVQHVFAVALGMPDDYFVELHSGENVTMRLLHYPPMHATENEQLGAGAHTDYGMVTLLLQDMVGGLEVQDKDGVWQPVEPIEGNIVINTGDLTERWTNGKFRSTPHRVQPRGGVGDRYSIAMFVDPDTEVMVECIPGCETPERPAGYPPISAGDHILAKIAATH